MREPDFQREGWCLDDGEVRHSENPSTFEIPDLAVRQILQPGDFAKLIFRIALDDNDDGEAVERMWVIVRERRDGGYVGMLDNLPTLISEDDALWLGTELPFDPRHIIDVARATQESVELAKQPAPIPWLVA